MQYRNVTLLFLLAFFLCMLTFVPCPGSSESISADRLTIAAPQKAVDSIVKMYPALAGQQKTPSRPRQAARSAPAVPRGRDLRFATIVAPRRATLPSDGQLIATGAFTGASAPRDENEALVPADILASVWPGPDGYGYAGGTVTFNWLDISGTGTAVGLGDDNYGGPYPVLYQQQWIYLLWRWLQHSHQPVSAAQRHDAE
jgi:hypothetical protein